MFRVFIVGAIYVSLPISLRTSPPLEQNYRIPNSDVERKSQYARRPRYRLLLLVGIATGVLKQEAK